MENEYDVVTISGGFVPGHVPMAALHDLVRMCKSGELLCFDKCRNQIYDFTPSRTACSVIIHRSMQGRNVALIKLNLVKPNQSENVRYVIQSVEGIFFSSFFENEKEFVERADLILLLLSFYFLLFMQMSLKAHCCP